MKVGDKKLEKITLYSSEVYLSEENSNPDSYIAKFIICDFSRNKNGVGLERTTIENWMSTLRIKPLVGKIKMRLDGEYDFTSHNVKEVEMTDENGEKYKAVEFDTDAFGSFFDVAIETINEKEYLVASCEIWKRFTKACEIIVKRIQSGTLHTSWEIAIEKSHQGIIDGLMTKIIDAGRFIGHCLLGEQVSPAYDSSGLLEIASTNYDLEFAEAIAQDIMNQELDTKKDKKEEDFLKENVKTSETEKTKTKDGVENIEASALTYWDLRMKISEACRDKADVWCWVSYIFPEEHEVWCEYGEGGELDYLKFTYTVENDEVTVSEPEKITLVASPKTINTVVSEYEKTISEKDELIVKVSSEMTELKTENTELSQYKEKFTAMEQEKMQAELSAKKEELVASVVKSGQITKEEIEKSEELSTFVDNLDKKSLMAIVGERLLASVDNKEEKTRVVETSNTSTASISFNLNNEEDETVDKISIMRKFLGK